MKKRLPLTEKTKEIARDCIVLDRVLRALRVLSTDPSCYFGKVQADFSDFIDRVTNLLYRCVMEEYPEAANGELVLEVNAETVSLYLITDDIPDFIPDFLPEDI